MSAAKGGNGGLLGGGWCSKIKLRFLCHSNAGSKRLAASLPWLPPCPLSIMHILNFRTLFLQQLRTFALLVLTFKLTMAICWSWYIFPCRCARTPLTIRDSRTTLTWSDHWGYLDWHPQPLADCDNIPSKHRRSHILIEDQSLYFAGNASFWQSSIQRQFRQPEQWCHSWRWM